VPEGANGVSDFVMPFGKHRGQPITAVPRAYLTWLLANVTDLYPETRRAIQEHLRPPELPMEGREPDEVMPTQTTRRRTTTRTPRQQAPPPAPRCDVCGHVGTTDEPLVHRRCANDETPF
jgi:hypothetical protein